MTAPTPDARGQTGALALAIALWLLLADAAVETFLGGAFLRWWVVAAVTAFLTVMGALFWRNRTTGIVWSRYATASLIGLLALLAATAWLPDGLTNGVVMLRQPTPVVLSAVSALAVAAAGLMLARATFLPWWGRAALGLLAVYGVAAFAVGVTEATDYSTLFQGGSLWRRLPYWLQGAFIGTVIAVPLAIVAAIADAFRQVRAAEGRGWGFQQSLALGLATLMAVSGFTTNGGPIVGVADPGRTVPQRSAGEITKPLDDVQRRLALALRSTSNASPEPQEIQRRLEQLFSSLEKVRDGSPEGSFDVDAVIQRAGRDPDDLVAWVAGETTLLPYQGLLRGDVGVLMDRVGNSLDRAVLLYKLLRASGHAVRLARGVLASDQAAILLERGVGQRVSPSSGLAPRDTDLVPIAHTLLRQTAPAYGMSDLAIEEQLKALEQAQTQLAERVVSQVAAQTDRLAAYLPHRARGESDQSAALDALRDHWWVQRKEGSEWIDCDPTASTTCGKALAVPVGTFAADSLDDLPENLHHTIGIRVVIEQLDGTKVREHVALHHTLRPASLHGVNIVLHHYPLKWPRDMTWVQEGDAQANFRRVVQSQNEWAAVLRVGEESIFQASFTDAGDLNTSPFAPLVGSSAQSTGRAIGDMLGGTRGERKSVRNDTQLTAEWIEYEVNTPGVGTRRIRREIFDLIGPAARTSGAPTAPPQTAAVRLSRGLTLLGETEILPLVSQPSRAFVEGLLLQTMLANRPALMKLAHPPDPADPLAAVRELRRLPSRLYALALARREWNAASADVYLDRTNILTHHSRLSLSADDRIGALNGFDIVANEVAVRPNSAKSPFRIRLEQGVVDANAETALIAGCASSLEVSSCVSSANVADLFRAFDSTSAPWVAMEGQWAGPVEMTADVRARIEADLKEGYVVVAPQRPLSDTERSQVWWRIDPDTGDLLGRGHLGWGQAITESFEFKLFATLLLFAAAQFVCMGITTVRGTDTLRNDQLCVVGAAIGAPGVFWGTAVSVVMLLLSAALGGLAAT